MKWIVPILYALKGSQRKNLHGIQEGHHYLSCHCLFQTQKGRKGRTYALNVPVFVTAIIWSLKYTSNG